MSRFFKKKQNISSKKNENANETAAKPVLVASLEKNVETIRELFKDVDILRLKYINSCDKSLICCIAYCDGMVDNSIINKSIINPMMLSSVAGKDRDSVYTLMTQVIQIGGMKETDNIDDIVEAISYGDTVLFADGLGQAIILDTKGFQTRPINEPENEKNLSGSREGFTESLLQNLSMIRRRVLTSELKMKSYTIGRRTKTKAYICYMEGVVNKQILSELYRRLDKIDIDGILDTNYITEFISDAPWSPFRTIGYTERPDAVVGKLLEGRIAIFLDGTPTVLTLPYLFIENFQSSEDYYLNFYYTSFSRMVRIVGFFLSVAVPGIYIAAVAFHHEMLPLQLFINIASERQTVPLPAALEVLILLFVFDILRETGVRMPSNIGQTLGIVGALVVGQAAVEAKLVAAPMIIVVALTGITGLLIPKLNSPIVYIRLMLLLLASAFGFYGLILGISCVLIHIINLRSFGVPQLTITGKLRFQEIKDTLIRAPWWKMILRPGFAEDSVRSKEGGNQNE